MFHRRQTLAAEGDELLEILWGRVKELCGLDKGPSWQAMFEAFGSNPEPQLIEIDDAGIAHGIGPDLRDDPSVRTVLASSPLFPKPDSRYQDLKVKEDLYSLPNMSVAPAETPSAPQAPDRMTAGEIRNRLDVVRGFLSRNNLDEAESLVQADAWQSPELQNAKAVCRLHRSDIPCALELLGQLCYPGGSDEVDGEPNAKD